MDFLQNNCGMLKLQDNLGAASLGAALLGRADEAGVRSLHCDSILHLGLGAPLDPASPGSLSPLPDGHGARPPRDVRDPGAGQTQPSVVTA